MTVSSSNACDRVITLVMVKNLKRVEYTGYRIPTTAEIDMFRTMFRTGNDFSAIFSEL